MITLTLILATVAMLGGMFAEAYTEDDRLTGLLYGAAAGLCIAYTLP